jgi:galactokinase
MCLELGTAVVGAEAQGDEVCLYSTSVQEELRCDLSCVSQAKGSGEGEWVGIAKACIAKFSDGYKEKEGKPLGAQGFRAVIASNIPHCSDLGDAASLVVAIMTFLEELFRCRFKVSH